MEDRCPPKEAAEYSSAAPAKGGRAHGKFSL
jgi:hypothetical protein